MVIPVRILLTNWWFTLYKFSKLSFKTIKAIFPVIMLCALMRLYIHTAICWWRYCEGEARDSIWHRFHQYLLKVVHHYSS